MNDSVKLMYRKWYRNKKLLFKLLSVSAATAITFHFFYSKNLTTASNRYDRSNDKLISVHMFSRHGARTPLHLIKGLDEAVYKPDLLEPYIHAKYKLKTLDNKEFEDIISYYDQRNFDYKLTGGAGRGQVCGFVHFSLNSF